MGEYIVSLSTLHQKMDVILMYAAKGYKIKVARKEVILGEIVIRPDLLENAKEPIASHKTTKNPETKILPPDTTHAKNAEQKRPNSEENPPPAEKKPPVSMATIREQYPDFEWAEDGGCAAEAQLAVTNPLRCRPIPCIAAVLKVYLPTLIARINRAFGRFPGFFSASDVNLADGKSHPVSIQR